MSRAGGVRGALRVALLFGAAFALPCCGGGGSSPPDGGHADARAEAPSDGSFSKDARSDGGSHVDAHGDSGTTVATLKGAVQKGPFILGSAVQISAINGSGSPTGTVFNTATTDSLGDFDVTFSYLGYVDMQASGFYYDEVTGAPSAAPILLRALYDVKSRGAQNAYINIVTHLAHNRAVALMGGDAGMTLEAAESQAETELVAALGIGGTGFAPGGVGVTLDELGTNNDKNAYLFAVSAIMVETVIQQNGTTSLDANLQALLDTIASDLAAGGTLPSSLTSQIRAAEQGLDVDLTMDLFANHLSAIGSSATPANLDRAVDSDGDGYRDTIDTCPLVANPTQSMIPADVLCTVSRHTTLLPAAPVVAGTPILVADFENTGHAGALVPGAANWSLLLGDGTGRFAAPLALTLPASFAPQIAYDIDKDGNLDLASPSGWVAGDGKGSFGALAPFDTADAGAVFGPVAIGDFNGDGVPDVAEFGAGGVASLLAATPGVFGSPISSSAPFGGGTPGAWLFAFDVNDDGNLDLVALSTASVVALLGDGKGHFQASTSEALFSAGGAAVADFDGDGNIDVAGWDGSSSVQIVFGDGNGAFGSSATTSVGSAEVAVGDYNSDGKSDLWIGYSSSPCNGKLGVLLSQGRTFGPPQALDATPGACSPLGFLVSHDLNGDGTPDTVLMNQDSDGTWSLQGYVVGEMADYVCAGMMCNGACVDTTSNWFNCSKCGDACLVGATCAGGVCACNGMDAVCGDACVDKSRNNDNCGTCGHECTDIGTSCQSGTCKCAPPLIDCSGTCVDTGSDNANCGGCGVTCSAPSPSTAQCTAGRCLITLSSGPLGAVGIAVDGTTVYWSEAGIGASAGAIKKLPIGGGLVTTLVATGLTAGGVVVDTANVYFTAPGGSDRVMSVPLAGGGVVSLATGNYPDWLGVDAKFLYWANANSGSVMKVPKVPSDGGAGPSALAASPSPYFVALDSANVYWGDVGTGDGGAIMSTPKSGTPDGGAPVVLGLSPRPNGIAVDSASVYWADGNDVAPPGSGTVKKVPLGGGSIVTLVTGAQEPFGLAVDATSVYWTDVVAGTVMKAPIAGGTPTTLASGQSQPYCITVDATSVYWTNYAGTVMQVTPK